ncbi:MAG: thioesterase family protein [Alphaproteobacteria bacterium]|nr:thioesterase family protein [Alphaproteobacteria bacterium]
MENWTETCRGSVAPWECDVTEHFTIAYYFDRIGEAEAGLAAHLGLGELLGSGVFGRRFHVRFARELRAGDSFHIASAAIGTEGGLRLGHRIIDSTDGETVTWVEAVWDCAAAPILVERQDLIRRALVEWNGPPIEPRAEPNTAAGFIPTARGRAGPADFDEHNRFSLAAFVHRFTTASLQSQAAMGMTAHYMQDNRRGFSTFELVLQIEATPGLGQPYLVETGISHLGGSSVRFAHWMSDPLSGQRFARMGQFGVQLDLDARRPARLPDQLRARAEQLVVATG